MISETFASLPADATFACRMCVLRVVSSRVLDSGCCVLCARELTNDDHATGDLRRCIVYDVLNVCVLGHSKRMHYARSHTHTYTHR